MTYFTSSRFLENRQVRLGSMSCLWFIERYPKTYLFWFIYSMLNQFYWSTETFNVWGNQCKWWLARATQRSNWRGGNWNWNGEYFKQFQQNYEIIENNRSQITWTAFWNFSKNSWNILTHSSSLKVFSSSQKNWANWMRILSNWCRSDSNSSISFCAR